MYQHLEENQVLRYILLQDIVLLLGNNLITYKENLEDNDESTLLDVIGVIPAKTYTTVWGKTLCEMTGIDLIEDSELKDIIFQLSQ